ncbi:MAG: hypothetical protein JWM89_3520 [Acidimicrobiales bacterium]|nr:hypothetical protein [Acidimicrobiales bacterium]
MRNLPRAVVLAASFAVAAAACGSSGGSSDPAATAPRRQAVEKLHAYGLTQDQASCIVDHVGADPVVESDDLDAFAQGQDYRTAAKACLHDA